MAIPAEESRFWHVSDKFTTRNASSPVESLIFYKFPPLFVSSYGDLHVGLCKGRFVRDFIQFRPPHNAGSGGVKSFHIKSQQTMFTEKGLLEFCGT